MFEELGPEAANKFRLFVDVMEAMGQPTQYQWLDVDGKPTLCMSKETTIRFARWVGGERGERLAHTLEDLDMSEGH